MVRISGKTFEGVVSLKTGEAGAEIEVLFEQADAITDEDLIAMKNATLLEDLVVNYGEVTGVRGSYALYGWRSIRTTTSGKLQISWQTYQTTDVSEMQSRIAELEEQLAAAIEENEVLEDALLELAEIIGNADSYESGVNGDG